MITYFPTILGLGIDNIRGRITDLRELGFNDPVKMVTSSPTILGLAIDNIRGRIAELTQVGILRGCYRCRGRIEGKYAIITGSAKPSSRRSVYPARMFSA